MAVSSWAYEKRPLKKAKLGPPDVYPQDPKQKEDELTGFNLRQGFKGSPRFFNEHDSAINSYITTMKVGSLYSALLEMKQEANRFKASRCKGQQINPEDNFWPVFARTKNAIENWFNDPTGSKSLTVLAKKEKQRIDDGDERTRNQIEVESEKKNPVPGSGSKEAVGCPSLLSLFELNLEDNPLKPTPKPNEIKSSKKTEVVPKKSEKKSKKKLASNKVSEKTEWKK